ncbi:hypothetical protein [Paenibacillus kobensis]|uniref:hypothetical protein n=1 Tax=Paenibacillus kobensis TaxID=59841 RepID=UPI000FD833EF|nr:hypothetical protein [Paenibacillus kobensis]
MREHDWKIHEYMGNDLTGWEWHSENKFVAVRYDKMTYMDIPQYSTTWEGAGLVMEAASKQDLVLVYEITAISHETGSITYEGRFDGMTHNVRASSLPELIYKAYISAMEERDNG